MYEERHTHGEGGEMWFMVVERDSFGGTLSLLPSETPVLIMHAPDMMCIVV